MSEAIDWSVSKEHFPSDYVEQYYVDVDNTTLEDILENAEGIVEINDGVATRYMPECFGKSKVPFFLSGKWFNFLEPNYEVSGLSHGIKFEDRDTVLAPDLNLFNRNRPTGPAQRFYLMLAGQPAPNWCLEVEWEHEVTKENKGFNKVLNLFELTGANGTTIDEIWLLVYPQAEGDVQIDSNVHPVQIPLSQERPPRGSRYIAIFARDLDSNAYAHEPGRPYLVGYYLIQPNMLLHVPKFSLLHGVPDILTNQLLAVMGYRLEEVNP